MKNNGFVGWRSNFPGKKKKCQKIIISRREIIGKTTGNNGRYF